MEYSNFILWSARAQGWLTRGGSYTSDRSMARVYNFTETMDMIKLHHSGREGEFGLLPVSTAMLELLDDKR